MVTCSVVFCSVNHINNPEKYTFHRFPQDPLIRGKWLTLIGRVGWNPNKNSTICSKHFIDNFKRKSRINTVLVKGAIPTLFVPGTLRERIPTSYVTRDILSTHTLSIQERNLKPSKSSIVPEHFTVQEEVALSSRNRKLISKNDKLKKNLQEKQKIIRRLVAKNKRQAEKIVTLKNVIKEINTRLDSKDHRNDVIKQ